MTPHTKALLVVGFLVLAQVGLWFAPPAVALAVASVALAAMFVSFLWLVYGLMLSYFEQAERGKTR